MSGGVAVKGPGMEKTRLRKPLCGQLDVEAVGDKTESCLPGECKTMLGFALHLTEWNSGEKKVRDQVLGAIGREGQVSGTVRDLKGASHQCLTDGRVLRPWHGKGPEAHVDASCESIQPAPLRQIDTELAKAEARLVIAEAVPQDNVKRGIGVARSVAVAMLQT